MNDDRRYELISAYLDGELTPAEQAEVEQLLAEDAAARQLHQELRALSDALRALPRHEVEGELAEQVLRRAERTILTQRTSDDETSSGSALRWLKKIPFGRDPRSWGWAAAAIAAAVLVMIFNPEQEPEHVPVARHAPRASGDAEMSALDDPAAPESAAPQTMRAAPQADEAADNQLGESAAQPPGDAEGAAADRMATTDQAREAAPPAAAMEAPRTMMQRRSAPPPQAEMAADMALQSAPAADASFEQQLMKLSSAGVMVVQLDVTAEAAARGALEEILTRQAISLDPPTVAASAPESTQKLGAAAAQQDQRSRTESLPLQAEGEGAESPLEMVYLEAAPEAVAATLAALASRPQEFLAIDIEPAPGAERQQAFSAYGRGQPQQELQLQADNAPPRAMRKHSAGQTQKTAPPGEAAPPQPQSFSAAEPQTMRALSAQPDQPALGRAQRVRTPQEIQPAPPPSIMASPPAEAESADAEKEAPADQAPRENESSDASTGTQAPPVQKPMRVLFLLRVQAEEAQP